MSKPDESDTDLDYCRDKFGKASNHGGFDRVPVKRRSHLPPWWFWVFIALFFAVMIPYGIYREGVIWGWW